MSGPRKAQPLRFDSRWLAQRLGTLLDPARQSPAGWCVAWSGGADSTALLGALLELRAAAKQRGSRAIPLRALHVDHHLQPAAAGFRQQCQRLARQWRLPLTVLDARIDLGGGVSVEEAAREARYRLLGDALRPGECLLTGQHAEDQLETVLLQGLRGAGVAGLAGMPERAVLGAGLLLRPLLGLPGESLRAYLREHALPWVEDPTNSDTRFDRNYLRQAVLPLLLQRWPAAARTVGRSARHAAEAAGQGRREAQRDVESAADGAALDARVLRRLSVARQRSALRRWIEGQGHAVPDERRLAEVTALLDLRADARPCVQWDGIRLRRHQDRLLLDACPAELPVLSLQPWDWHTQPRRALGAGVLRLQPDPWGDVDLDCLPRLLELRWRAGGEHLATGGCRRDVKSLLREAGIPEWRRAQVPMVWAPEREAGAVAAELLAVADIDIADTVRWREKGGRRGRFIWQQV